MNTSKLLLTAVLSACSCNVFAQWQWLDETGRKVFSDRPPPAHIQPQKILQRPGGMVAPAPQVIYPGEDNNAPGALTPPAPVVAPAPVANTEEAAKNRQAEEAEKKAKADEAAHRRAEEAERQKQAAQQAKVRQDNCQRARAAQTALQSGSLMPHVNEKGERGLMTEPQRQVELQRVQQAIQDNCK